MVTMVLVIAAVLVFLVICVCFFFIFFRKASSNSKSPEKQKEKQAIPASKTPVDLSVFDEICANEGVDGKIDFQPLSEDDNNEIIKFLFSEKKPLPQELLKRNPPVRIVYVDHKDEKTIRDIIPFRIIGSVDVDEKDGTKEYDFYIEAYCLLRNQERSFHANGISAAWFQGRENNLGDYLAALYRRHTSH